MRKLTVKQAQALKPGANVLLMRFKYQTRTDIAERIITKIVDKKKAIKEWKDVDKPQPHDVWYWYAADKRCYSMMENAKQFCWEEVYTFDDDELDKVKLLMDV